MQLMQLCRVKGTKFTIPNLLNVSPDSDIAKTFADGSLASFRCRGQTSCPRAVLTYRVGWHPRITIASTALSTPRLAIASIYLANITQACHYTLATPTLTLPTTPVNPQAVNESGFDVFTDNKRSVLYMTHIPSGKPVAFVAIGAMLVSSTSSVSVAVF